MTNNPFLSQDQQIVGDIYTANEMMDNLTTLCDEFGSRFGGTEGERQAADFMKAKLEAYGLSNIHLEPVEYTGWMRGQATLEIISPIRKEIPCISLPHSPPTDMEAGLIDMGDGAPADFDAHSDEIKGKMVLTNSVVGPPGVSRWIHRTEKYGRSILAGATGFIFVNHYPGYGPATGGIGHEDEAGLNEAGLIPGISVAYEDGAFIQRLIKRHGKVKIRLKTTDRIEPMTSWNIIADLPGKETPEQVVIIGCHYDGHDISQGAGDPASGVAAVLETARVLVQYGAHLPCTVRFALWGVEEIGLIGSKQYVAAHKDDLENIRFYLNMDAAGMVEEKGIVLNEWPELKDIFSAWSEEMALGFEVGQSVHAFSDHFPFFMQGAPTGGMQQVRRSLSGRGYGHTAYDTLDKVTLRSLREAAAMAARLLLRLASAGDWPVTRRARDDVLSLLDGPDYREEAEFRKQLAAHYAKERSKLEIG
jgi:Zn-dependent M28 family amino/carboxypeptidase